MGQGWDCESLQTLKVIRRPEAPALPLLCPEMGKLWRCYASIFLAGVWVHIPFPPGYLWADEPWQSLLPGTWWVSAASLWGGGLLLQQHPEASRHRARPLLCNRCCRTVMFLCDVPGFQLCLCVSR